MNQKIVRLIIALSLLCGLVTGAGPIPLHDVVSKASAAEEAAAKSTARNELEKIEKAYDLISNEYVEQVDREKLLEGAIQGMLSTLNDPYSVYMDKQTAKRFSDSLDSSFEGIGAEIGMEDRKIIIVSPFKQSPAEKAGLKPNDEIISIDGDSMSGMDLNDAVLKIRGKKGSTVTLKVHRPGMKDQLTFTIKRDEIPLETVFASIKKVQDKPVGYIAISSFSEHTAKDFTAELKKLEKKGIKGLVLDVRGNPGGYLQSVEDILKHFVTKDHPYIQIAERNGNKKQYFSKLKEKKPYPVSVITDKGSASASEILAGALKEAEGYDVVGDPSFGKGTVQQAVPMGDGSNIKLTLYKWLTPKGNWIHKQGIQPTVPVTQPAYFSAGPLQLKEPLKPDMNNNEIKRAQFLLKGLGFVPGREDGYYNESTKKAVMAFQAANKLKQTGIIDQKTANTMNLRIEEKKMDEKNDLQLQAALKVLFNKK
ncbi:S41 family peptidase [Bacillus sp. GM2]|jgi:carboxyl-terminal processing protease|uniref:C-terminal processing peptidase n=2 Tax=Bacillus licheniformis TaxID=1402 RepID=Q65ED3_BACLD|nr:MULTISPECIES: S41 family peptidase [Bacillus]MBY8348150.1 S41 family peptidase [Bacillus sp. PCH94]MDP4080165.1 S41 family peptidase [Bacillota bacterium]AAU25209.1 Peptidase S41A, C-terminal protease [Bacillus licheniformis DSM 13 = ATCC 14580]AAU42581.1 carboxy-terminal processing protease CtpB [Bacillus licheniformis DSM 13 = ATCC 14580]AMR12112.1 peptidase S41 [Bacillus licheniformis]